MIPILPFEYCAFRYLELWERDEKSLHRDMQGTPSSDQIRRVLKHYRVARNFKGLTDEGAKQISDYLLEASDGEGTYSDRVMSLAGLFKKKFGQFNLSAASKLLWLRNTGSYLIFDKRAADGLRRLGNKIDDYKSYCHAWQGEYEKRCSEITLAAHGLVNLPRRYTRDPSLTDDQLTELVRKDWFIARVFNTRIQLGSATERSLKNTSFGVR
jgi:hypothetical protein